MTQKRAIVIGAGIVGLATTRKLAMAGYRVDVLERGQSAQGASVRNFGMVWPIGQPTGQMYDRAMISRSIWKEMAAMAGVWYGEVGSLHMAYRPEELAVIEEFVDRNPQYEILTADTVKSEAVVKKGLLGVLSSDEELIVDPRQAIAAFPGVLEEHYNVTFHWQHAATEVAHPKVKAGNQIFEADLIYVCSGADFECLYPQQYAEADITKSKLQMMRLVSQPNQWQIGPALCGGLTMVHYESFKQTPSHQALFDYYKENHPAYLKWGLNVMVSQNGSGELTIGDSHEYGHDFDPFNKAFVDEMILDYLRTFADFKDWTIDSHWHGIYPKMTNGATELILTPEEGVTIINGLGGAGMTLSFGLLEEILSDI